MPPGTDGRSVGGGRRDHSLTLPPSLDRLRRAGAATRRADDGGRTADAGLLLHQFLDELMGGVVDTDFEGEVAGEGMGGATGTQILTCPYKPVLSL